MTSLLASNSSLMQLPLLLLFCFWPLYLAKVVFMQIIAADMALIHVCKCKLLYITNDVEVPKSCQLAKPLYNFKKNSGLVTTF